MTRRPVSVLLALTVALTAISAPVGAQDLEDDLDRVQSQVAEMTAQIATAAENRSALASDVVATKTRLDDLLVDVGRTRLQLTTVREELALQEAVLVAARAQLSDLYVEMEKTQEDLDRGESEAVEWARQIYMSAGQDEAYLALSASHLSDISVGLEYLDTIATENSRSILVYESLRKAEKQQAERIRGREAAVAAEVAALDSLEGDLADLGAQLADQQAAIESELANQRSNLAAVESEIDLFEGELASLEAEQARLHDAIQAEQSSGGADTATGGGDTAAAAFVRPVPGRITSAFGPRSHPILGYVRMHTGLDFTAAYGQEIRAAQTGRVILATAFGGYGNTVVIDHGAGVATLYAHQSKLAVGYGAGVSAGEVIGYVGSTGLSTGPHLHFEVRVNGSPVDPASYL